MTIPRLVRGIILLEVMVAMSIVTTGLLTALLALSLSARNAGMTSREGQAVMLTRAKMEELLGDRQLAGGESEGAFGEEHSGYRWKAQVDLVQELRGMGVYEIRLETLWPERNGEGSYVLETRAARRLASAASQ